MQAAINKIGRLLRRNKKAVAAPSQEPPLFLMLGSLRDCTEKDADAYARGLAEKFVTAPGLGRIRVMRDAPRDRYVFEIHEGGASQSILTRVLEALERKEQVRIQLARGEQISVEEAHGELFSLLMPADQDAEPEEDVVGIVPAKVAPVPVLTFSDGTELEELFPENKTLAKTGKWMLIFSFSVFVLTGLSYTSVKSGMFDVDAMLTQTKAGIIANADDNPVWQLDKARAAAEEKSANVSKLKRDDKGWSWELTK